MGCKFNSVHESNHRCHYAAVLSPTVRCAALRWAVLIVDATFHENKLCQVARWLTRINFSRFSRSPPHHRHQEQQQQQQQQQYAVGINVDLASAARGTDAAESIPPARRRPPAPPFHQFGDWRRRLEMCGHSKYRNTRIRQFFETSCLQSQRYCIIYCTVYQWHLTNPPRPTQLGHPSVNRY